MLRYKRPLLFLIVINNDTGWLLLDSFYDIDHTNLREFLNICIFFQVKIDKNKKRDNRNDHEELNAAIQSHHR